MEDLTNPAVKAIMSNYSPIEVKRLLHNHDESCFVHHQTTKSIIDFYAEHNEDIHHWLLDDSHAFEYYAEAMGAYNAAQAQCTSEKQRHQVQNVFLKDVVYIFIATVAYDLAASHDMLDMTMQEVEDWQLAKDLEMQKNKLQLIQGGKS